VMEKLEDKDTANSRERTEECRALLNYYREVAEWVR